MKTSRKRRAPAAATTGAKKQNRLKGSGRQQAITLNLEGQDVACRSCKFFFYIPPGPLTLPFFCPDCQKTERQKGL